MNSPPTPRRTRSRRAGSQPPITLERRAAQRGRVALAWDWLFRALRFGLRLAHSVYGALGIVIVAGALAAALGALAFAELAQIVTEGASQRFDESVLRWMAARQEPWVEHLFLEITALGTFVVVFVTVVIAALFLWLTRHRYSAALLLVATLGGVVINNILKLGFDRPRPRVFEHAEIVSTTSFPSGHAMSAAIVYGTVAYLAARLQRRRWARIVTLLVAFALIALIAVSRMYLGVHYPSDVLGGIVVGLAWGGFCMALLEAIQRLGARSAPEVLESEEPPPPPEPERPA